MNMVAIGRNAECKFAGFKGELVAALTVEALRGLRIEIEEINSEVSIDLVNLLFLAKFDCVINFYEEETDELILSMKGELDNIDVGARDTYTMMYESDFQVIDRHPTKYFDYSHDIRFALIEVNFY